MLIAKLPETVTEVLEQTDKLLASVSAMQDSDRTLLRNWVQQQLNQADAETQRFLRAFNRFIVPKDPEPTAPQVEPKPRSTVSKAA